MTKYELINELLQRVSDAKLKRDRDIANGNLRSADYEDGKVTAYSMAAELAMKLS